MLLEAAEYVQMHEISRDREDVANEHGYASTMPRQVDYTRRRQKTRKTQGNRSTHNELEKNRRANLRQCLEQLKEIVPLGADSTRHTTLGLLVKAKSFIKVLEEKERKAAALKDELARSNRLLHSRMDELTKGQYRSYRSVERSLSECSASTSASSASSASSGYSASLSGGSSESDEVDILGYGSSDSDSIQSASDTGLATLSDALLLH